MTTNSFARYAAFGLLLTSAACGKKDEKQASAAPPPTPVGLTAARTTDAVYYDEYPATVVALNTVELRAQVSGFVTGIFFKEGELVPKGKTLYEIDQRKYQAAYQQALAGLRSAQAVAQNAKVNLDRYQRLAQQDAIARQIVDNASTAYATAQSQVAEAQAGVSTARTDLDYSLIKAPFTGRIGISQVRLGAQVSPGSTLLNTISSEDPVGADIVVNEKDIARFAQMQQRNTTAASDTTFRLVLPDGSAYAGGGKILAIDRGVDQQTGTMRVRVQFANPQRTLKDGMSAVVRVLNQQSGRRLVVPNRAIVEQMGENFVFVVQDSVANQHKVQLGPRLRDQIVIMSGIEEGDKVVTEGLQRLRDGGIVRVGDPAAAATGGAPSQTAAAK
ncbi:efflux RND transporter periplasmic adaptor subunit [Hymenobacter busanensis]|uniref:Efflux RND transporter periplasmic adaptor subunit n=1 Tax=Hymenobacter busanensis TaxID=2607656 RepID=A0A7L4ZXS6_9BACT|nr:efflux RND transporter periplasmic adaptor subunit [Hymenobacter busanensis]KAA9332037.1 efflux RND transporter periplasmic adaptor subunit [Hymenobacter busanensis]QHJ07625.1 efflux RND transporter periplasmic adaptor subunit [Hymenobacter busanensis]